jgi:hypothetical protein
MNAGPILAVLATASVPAIAFVAALALVADFRRRLLRDGERER